MWVDSEVGFSTGDVKMTIKADADEGWLLMDDKTIGNGDSAATGRADDDTENLYILLWNSTANAQCAVSGGRGDSAEEDFDDDKTIALPKTLGRALACFGAGSGLTERVMAEKLGTEEHQLTIPEMPAHTHGYTFKTGNFGSGDGTPWSGETTIQTGSTGGDGAHNNMQPTLFLNVMIKL